MGKILTIFAILSITSLTSQTSDSVTRQIEISGTGYKLYKVLYTQYALGVNFPAKKPNWYTNLALSVNIRDAQNEGVIFALYSFSVGKSYQHIRRHFFGTAGFNTGVFYGNFTSYIGTIRHIGINGIPKLEIGYNTKRTILSTGIYLSTGIGYRQELYQGETVPQLKPVDYVRITGALNLYLKLILK